MGAFKAYDIRGVYNKDFNKEDVYKIGFYLPELLNASKILVGRDVRTSSPEIFEYLSKGIIDSGADVHYIGLSTTPMVYYLTAKYHFDASVMITASHNPKEHNGLKISRTNALPVGFDTGLGELEKLVKSAKPEAVSKKGKIIEMDIRNEYISFLKQYLSDYSNLKIAVDCSNGMACLLIKEFLNKDIQYLYDELDGTFPNHEANPLEEENVEDLKRLVLKGKCDVGVIFDGDADRVMFVDENGKFVSPDLMIAVLAHYFLEEKGLKGNILQDIRTSKAVAEYIENFGSKMHMWRVGRAYAAMKLREINGIFGGELAGHYYFKDFYYSDSGIMASLIILGVLSKMKKKGISFSQLIGNIAKYANSGEINFEIEKKSEAMEQIKNYFTSLEKPVAFYDFDGYRIEFKDWWFNVRPSNTDPYLRFIAEANNQNLLNEKIEKVKEIIKGI
ncbi:MAG TPA: phosphomannomutase/phosphoglucomutase [Bacteroidales bacterium]|nr:phosphomannomutase/phosphoglucomutase [Bacteroidales bacterium]HPS15613.1 phosphomannomutase/phosphoglucomutase [Bacteroidales bacterium]